VGKKRLLVPVTRRALFQRIDRVLWKAGERLRTYRGGTSRSALGDLYIVDVKRNVVTGSHIDLERYGRELGVLKPYERLVEERRTQ